MSGPAGITRVEIVVPGTPPACLSPNQALRRGGHFPAEAARAQLRRDAGFAAVAVRQTCGGGPLFTGPVAVTERIVWAKGRRSVDIDAVPLMLKGALDGICDAKILANDSQVKRLTVLEHGRDKRGAGWVEIQVEEVTA